MLLAAGYQLGVALRGTAYRRGWFRTRRLPRPVVSVGNLTVGGTGKTPLVAYLAERLLERGWKPAILTRGYGRPSGAQLIAVNPAPGRAPDPREIGDEPALLARKLPEVPILVSADRYRAGLLAESRFGRDVHILDDGFQHLALAREVDVVVLDVTQKLTEGALLPAGRLREPWTALQRAHLIVLSRTELGDAAKLEERVRRINPRAKIFWGATRLSKVLDVAGGTLGDPEKWKDKAAVAFCGIGNARAFFADARRWGFAVVEEKSFGDHHVYDAGELDRLVAHSRKSDASALITTEKDVMNFPPGWNPGFPVGACVIQIELREPETFVAALVELLKTAKVSV